MVYFISEAKIKEMCNDNISSEIIKTGIINVQTIQLKEIIGDSLSKTLETLITNNVVVEPYKTLLDSYITPYMQYAVLAEIVVPATYKIGNIGLNQPYTDNVNTTTKSECVYVKQYYTERAAFMENRLTTYLEANRAVFTDYQNYKDITVAKSTTTQAGLFLGGKTRGNNVDNTTPTFIHDNTIRAYIRYDEAQNLTPEQQAQAKLNIGIEDINFDDIYTKDYIDSNYYTKQETDTAIQTAVDNVDIDLSEYYTKETVNNLLDNLPIPEATSELVKDDVYTKSEVYNKSEVDIKIANVSSGGSVDLSNYYNKQETESYVENAIADIEIPTKTSQLELDNTYSKTQVDTLISNVPTFSGDYEDLTNKPSIYTKNEIDTLISNINEFSGDYNDLTNKPDVYTKSQTDTAIQNAVDGIETFSGNYNDLTNKPTLFSGSYTDLSDKPTIPTDTAQLTKSDIYTKAETFTRDEIVSMINEINYSDINNTPTLSTVATSGSYNDLENKPTLFSGSYTDLTNTPTIPTATSQLQLDNVYTKSEIDLQFESVNTTLGDINNLLETI